ncbi:MAG: hypothetical protein K2H29_01350 [Oscillospiraceae bacterium]|nr:hypothetical protein [Oscillospiraceae bacterium]
MEFLISAIVIVVLLLILGVDPMMILLGGIWIIEIFFIFMAVFFVVSLILVFLTKKTKGEFLRIDPNEGVGTHAVYQIQDQECNNSFPAEIMFTDKIYHTGKTVTLRQRDGKKLKLLFDNYSMIVIATGLPVFTALAVSLGIFLQEITPYLAN